MLASKGNNAVRGCVTLTLCRHAAWWLGCTFPLVSTAKGVDIERSSARPTGAWQLLLDDHWVQRSSGMTRTLHQPRKHPQNPLIRGNLPWAINPYCFGTILYDPQPSIFKLWYMSYNYGFPIPERTPILYATSRQGVRWNSPHLGIHDFRGSTRNNILLQNYGHHDLYSPSVIKDETDPDADRRYKMVWWDFPRGPVEYQDCGMCVAFSSDGMHWKRHEHNPVLFARKTPRSISDVLSVMHDTRNQNYVVYSKSWADPWPSFRQVCRTESKDFTSWSEPEVVLTHAHDTQDPQSYGMFVTQYESVFLGLLPSYKKPGNDTIDIQLAVSHDNRTWSRVAEQKTFLPLGSEGSWDDGMISVAPLISRPHDVAIYYGGWDGPHNTTNRRGNIGMATLRKDGFVSLDAGSRGGTITTRPIRNAEGKLWLNANAVRGSVRVALLDDEGNVLPGYAADACQPLTTDSTRHQVTWKTRQALPGGDDQIRLRVDCQNASVYAFFAGQQAERGR